MKMRNKKAQSTLEYAIIMAVVVGALLAMQIYVKRAVEGRMRSTTDSVGDQFSAEDSRYVKTATDSGTTQTVREGFGLGNHTNTAPTWDLESSDGMGISYSNVDAAATMTSNINDSTTSGVNTTEENLTNKQGNLFDP